MTVNVLAIRFSGNKQQHARMLDFLWNYRHMTVRELIEKEYLLV